MEEIDVEEIDIYLDCKNWDMPPTAGEVSKILADKKKRVEWAEKFFNHPTRVVLR